MALAIAMTANLTMADGAQRPLTLPAQSLDRALVQIGEVYDISVVARQDLVAGLRAPAVTAQLSALQAVSQLLMDTGLSARELNDGSILVEAGTVASPPRPDSPDTLREQTRVSPPPREVEELVVVGTRFQQSLISRLRVDPREYPFTLDVLDREDLSRTGFIDPIQQVTTLANVTQSRSRPNVFVANFFTRGFPATLLINNRPSQDPDVGIYVDDSVIERIEVLKGATSIELGPVRPGGVINQVLKQPLAEDRVAFKLRGGSFDTFRGEVDLNEGALFGNDDVRGRLTFAYENSNAPQDEAERAFFVVRPVIEADLGRRTYITASASYLESDSVPLAGFPLFEDGTLPDSLTPSTYLGSEAEGVNRILQADAQLQHEFLDGLTLTMRGGFGSNESEERSYAGGYNYGGYSEFGYTGGIPFAYPYAYVYAPIGLEVDQDVLSAEATLSGSMRLFQREHDFVIGAAFRNETSAYDFVYDYYAYPVRVDINDPEAIEYPEVDLSDITFSLMDDLDVNIYSLFAEAILRPTDRLTIPLGLRYDTADGLAEGNAVEQDYDDLTFRGGVSYEVVDDANVYFSYAQSFIPQLFSQTREGPAAPETAENFEVGAKASFYGGRLSIDAALFSITRQNVATADPDNGPGEFFVVTVGEQRNRGIELSARAKPTPAITLTANYGYVDAEVTEDNELPIGQRLGRVPRHNAYLFASYAFQEGPARGLTIGGGIRFEGERLINERFPVPVDSYTLFDATVSYPFNNKLSITLNGLNLSDERYLSDLGFSGPSGGLQFAQPRALFVTINGQL
ncbi:MAG: TonB-dependent receptor [Pseudomonadota bacterium]